MTSPVGPQRCHLCPTQGSRTGYLGAAGFPVYAILAVPFWHVPGFQVSRKPGTVPGMTTRLVGTCIRVTTAHYRRTTGMAHLVPLPGADTLPGTTTEYTYRVQLPGTFARHYSRYACHYGPWVSAYRTVYIHTHRGGLTRCCYPVQAPGPKPGTTTPHHADMRVTTAPGPLFSLPGTTTQYDYLVPYQVGSNLRTADIRVTTVYPK